MPEKKLGFRSIVFWFLLFPLILIAFSFTISLPNLRYSMFPLQEISSYNSPSDVYSVLDIKLANLSSANNFASASVTWDQLYNVLLNSTRQPPVFSLTETTFGSAGFSAPMANYPSDNSTYFFNENGKWTWADFRTWKFSYDSSSPFQWNTYSFPIDKFESPPIYVWATDGSYPNIKLESSAITGFVVTLKPVGLVDSMTVYQQEDLGQRLFLGVPTSSSPYCFRIVVQRDMGSITLYSAYFAFVFLVVYLIGGFSRFVITDVEKRLGIIATLSISIVAFLWTLRQIAGSITYIEAFLFAELLLFVALEIKDKTDLAPLHKISRKIKDKKEAIEKGIRRRMRHSVE
jgi:hypothetical protein